MSIVTDIQTLRKKSTLCKSVSEGLKIGKKLITELEQHNKTKKNKGMGLAAIQIGIDKQVFIIKQKNIWLTFINPKILSESREEIDFEEGCLSLPKILVKTKRKLWIEVKCSNWKFSKKFGPVENLDLTRTEIYDRILQSVCVQHEYSHLFGGLITDFMNKV